MSNNETKTTKKPRKAPKAKKAIETKDTSPVEVAIDENGEPQVIEDIPDPVEHEQVQPDEPITTEEFDKKFDENKEDIVEHLDLTSKSIYEDEIQHVPDEIVEMQFESMKETAAKYEGKTLEETAKETALKIAAARRLRLGKADLTDQEDALLREVVQLQMRDDGQSIEQKHITQDMVDVLCAYGSFLGKLGWLRAKYHESMKK